MQARPRRLRVGARRADAPGPGGRRPRRRRDRRRRRGRTGSPTGTRSSPRSTSSRRSSTTPTTGDGSRRRTPSRTCTRWAARRSWRSTSSAGRSTTSRSTCSGSVLRGGRDVAAAAGVAVLGGHSITDPEPKYGMVGLGLVEPGSHRRATRPRSPATTLILTKPIGLGMISTAIKQGSAPPRLVADGGRPDDDARTGTPPRRCVEAGAEAATDVTGFGLLGHLHRMLVAVGRRGADRRRRGAALDPRVLDLVRAGVVRRRHPAQPRLRRPHVEWGSSRTRAAPARRRADERRTAGRHARTRRPGGRAQRRAVPGTDRWASSRASPVARGTGPGAPADVPAQLRAGITDPTGSICTCNGRGASAARSERDDTETSDDRARRRLLQGDRGAGAPRVPERVPAASSPPTDGVPVKVFPMTERRRQPRDLPPRREGAAPGLRGDRREGLGPVGDLPLPHALGGVPERDRRQARLLSGRPVPPAVARRPGAARAPLLPASATARSPRRS